MRADYAKLGLGAYAPAYISVHWGEHPEYKSLLTTLVFWDCFGDPLLIRETGHTSSSFAGWCGVGWAYPDYYCTSMNGHRYGDGMIMDVRSLEMIIAGCCPMELNADMMGTEGTPD